MAQRKGCRSISRSGFRYVTRVLANVVLLHRSFHPDILRTSPPVMQLTPLAPTLPSDTHEGERPDLLVSKEEDNCSGLDGSEASNH